MPSSDFNTAETDLLRQIVAEIIIATDAVQSGEHSSDTLPTASEISRRLGLKLDKLKKKLKCFKQAGVISPVSSNPKRYRFDHYTFAALEADHPLSKILEPWTRSGRS